MQIDILHSYVFGPTWFHGYDSLIELFAVIVSVLLLYYSYKCYKLTEEKRYLYFSAAFFSITLAFIAKVLGTLAIYSRVVRESAVSQVIDRTFTDFTIYSVDSIGFLAYIFFMILGFMILFLIASKLSWKNLRVIAMLTYLVIVSTLLGGIHYQFFYLTVLLMLGLITYSYYINYKEIKSKNSLIVVLSLGVLLLSQVFFIFAIYSKTSYVIGEVLQLLGFLFLLIPFVLIFIKKPKQKLVK